MRPQYFVDNNGDLQGQTIGKIKILSPKECREKDLSNKWIYVIADECEEKVFYQLLNLGVAQEHITMYK